MVLTLDGAALRGVITFPSADLGIEEFAINPRNVTFKTLRRVGGEVVTFNWTGIVTGDQIAFTYQDAFREYPAIKVVVTRQQ